jgi:hypothetical protein
VEKITGGVRPSSALMRHALARGNAAQKSQDEPSISAAGTLLTGGEIA